MTNETRSHRLRLELQEAKAELERARRQIAWMEMSRFWKIRSGWFAFKGLFRRNDHRPRSSAASNASFLRSSSGAPSWLVAAPIRSLSHRERPDPSVEVIVLAEDPRTLEATLESVVGSSRAGDALSILDVGLPVDAGAELARLAQAHAARIERLDRDGDRTLAIRRLLKRSKSDFAILLDGAAIVTTGWLDRLVDCAASDPRIDLVTPLSNAMDAALVPDGAGLSDLAIRIAAESGRLYPLIQSLSGPCVLLRVRSLSRIAITADSDRLLLHPAGALALADDAYVFSGERRAPLTAGSGESGGTGRVFAMIGERTHRIRDLRARRLDGRRRWEGKRVLFVLPVVDRGGGANVVLREARSMAEMGVDARVLNLKEFRVGFEKSYPEPGVPVLFAEEDEIPEIGSRFDAVVATANRSVEWLLPLARPGGPALGYYIQDFEPYFFPVGSPEHEIAWSSYDLIPGLRRFTKTDWNRRQVEEKRGVPCRLVGPSFDADLFRPRFDAPPDGPVRVAAMIRPSTPRRAPERTMAVLARLFQRRRGSVEIVLFGVDPADSAFRELGPSFPYHTAGVLSDEELVNLLSQVHVFADLSSFQAMGLTALEAMACGAAVIVPEKGGATSFARHEANALIVDTSSEDACLAALERLVDDAPLRCRLADRAMRDVLEFHPDAAAFRILEAVFDDA